ncbi:glycoside hydrolase family 88 protein [Trichoderma evansii]
MNGIHKRRRGEERGDETEEAPVRTKKSDNLPNGVGSRNHFSEDKTSSILSGLEFIHELYSDSAAAKIWGIAQRDLNKPVAPTLYPEYTKPGGVKYIYRELEFWTSGFFPGSLHVLLERQRRFGHVLERQAPGKSSISPHVLQLEFACRWWTVNLHSNSQLEGTHDLGFMIAPWARRQWELHHDTQSFATMISAAKTLAMRFNPIVGAIRSWDNCQTKVYSFKDLNADFLVIIVCIFSIIPPIPHLFDSLFVLLNYFLQDNLMNLDIVFWAAAQTNDNAMFNIALSHAKLSQRELVRLDSTTSHLVNFDPATGTVKERLTNQGMGHESCWARGQAWAITGFAQTYNWTGDVSFLKTSKDCADYFLANLPETLIPPWDFDAPKDGKQPTDTSAAVIAAYGMLLIHESLAAYGDSSEYLTSALRILNAVCAHHLNPPAKFVVQKLEVETVEHGASLEQGAVTVDLGDGETILNGATINNFEFAPRRWANHGLVYADYFFLLCGNKLLEMGIGQLILRAK